MGSRPEAMLLTGVTLSKICLNWVRDSGRSGVVDPKKGSACGPPYSNSDVVLILLTRASLRLPRSHLRGWICRSSSTVMKVRSRPGIEPRRRDRSSTPSLRAASATATWLTQHRAPSRPTTIADEELPWPVVLDAARPVVDRRAHRVRHLLRRAASRQVARALLSTDPAQR